PREEFERGRVDRAERGVCELHRALRVAVFEELYGEPQTLRDRGRRADGVERVGQARDWLRVVVRLFVRGRSLVRSRRVLGLALARLVHLREELLAERAVALGREPKDFRAKARRQVRHEGPALAHLPLP